MLPRFLLPLHLPLQHPLMSSVKEYWQPTLSPLLMAILSPWRHGSQMNLKRMSSARAPLLSTSLSGLEHLTPSMPSPHRLQKQRTTESLMFESLDTGIPIAQILSDRLQVLGQALHVEDGMSSDPSHPISFSESMSVPKSLEYDKWSS